MGERMTRHGRPDAILIPAVILLVAACACGAPVWVDLGGAGRPAPALRPAGAGPAMRVSASEAPSELLLTFALDGVWAEEISLGADVFADIRLDGAGRCGRVGAPALPVVRKLIELPEKATAHLSVLGETTSTFNLANLGLTAPLTPVQPPLEKLPGAQRGPAVIDPAAYSSAARFGAEAAKLVDLGTARGRGRALLEFYPLAYSPATGEITFRSRIDVSIALSVPAGGAPPRVVQVSEAAGTEPYASGEGIKFVGLPGYLIITADSLVPDVAPLAEWRRRVGFDVTVTSASAAGSTASGIRSYIADAVDNWASPPAYVLLVGDTHLVPNFTGIQTYSPATDLYYACLDGGIGDDYQQDTVVGRLPADDGGELADMIERVIHNERYVSPAPWVSGAAFLASLDHYEVSEDTHNYFIDSFAQPSGYVSRKLYRYTYSADSDDVRDAINAGLSLLVYSGHGSTTYWADGPLFYASDVQALTNFQMYPAVYSFACYTGDFASGDCFAETWLSQSDKGAVCFWGSSVTSYWDEDDILEKSLCDDGYSAGVTRAGVLCDTAKQGLQLHYGLTSMVKRYFEQYNLMGDPASILLTSEPGGGVPHAFDDVTHQGSVEVGPAVLDVTVRSGGSPVEGASACAWRDGEIHVVAYTDPLGQVSLAFESQSMGDVLLTITKHNYAPYEAAIEINSGPLPDLRAHSLDCPAFAEPGEAVGASVNVENVGEPGSDPSPPCEIAWYVSIDDVLDENDADTGVRTNVPSIAVGGEETLTDDVTIPSGLGLDSYNLIAVVDELDQVPEADKGNNQAHAPIVVGKTAVSGPFDAGWTLVAVPLSPAEPAADAVFDNCFAHPGTQMWHYDNQTGYSNLPTEMTDVEPGCGYWLFLTDAVAYEDACGLPIEGTGPATYEKDEEPDVPIASPSMIESRLQVPVGTPQLTGIRVCADFSHDAPTGLEVGIEAPSLAYAVLQAGEDREGGWYDADSSPQLASLVGEDPVGTWTLVIWDNWSGGTGMLRGWTLELSFGDWAEVPLGEGWCLVGHPREAPVDLASCLVSDGTTFLPLQDAGAAGWLQAALFGYDGAYVELPRDQTMLLPWCGYWVLTYRPGLSLFVPAQ